MRTQLSKLKKGNSTKAERIFSEYLKALHLPFQTKVKIDGKEVDFLVANKLVVELDGHNPNYTKLGNLKTNNYHILQMRNWEVKAAKPWILQILSMYKN